MTQSASTSQFFLSEITPFQKKLNRPLTKQKITILQINLGKRCNLACNHCHVEAGPKRTEELSSEICEQLIELIHCFPQIKTVDLTGGAPEMNYGFKPLVEAARKAGKEVIVRSNLTIFFETGYKDLPEYLAKYQLRVIASLPCYLENNVDRQRGAGVYQASIKAIQKLNQLGYGKKQDLILDLVYNPQLPKNDNFSLTPNQVSLERDYKQYLEENFQVIFNRLFAITNLPIGRVKNYLNNNHLYVPYLKFLESHHNSSTVSHLMCRNQLSIDYLGNVYDCDFNQMENLPATLPNGEALTIVKLLEAGNLDLIQEIKTAAYCYGCTAGSGSSCEGALI
ncbi:MAG: arsenosugar biosynthesis radical SAM protein ArsS [Hydrococcus sp. C42_A2020_068]|uniref:arsenosugar biosynthesis radical SAM (seleno)protein ArsS n=1 Tax=Pleurocapsa sp. PCC 7327 TaxID=118163 RepID=UPI00029FDC9F|nr:arsenosugar biosynthesis radical SAM (seleno)protein ArsS [Pleurocapsa sp. PCC 7327]AFY76167.1 putative Fe-S oxidoreductase [Pleurocapsa sp. PCC 7327]MBF2019020.1 arsenosugar biosynthesis radical SAM protein ArsS [Hydrococcus sp. C42_A2020_068]